MSFRGAHLIPTLLLGRLASGCGEVAEPRDLCGSLETRIVGPTSAVAAGAVLSVTRDANVHTVLRQCPPGGGPCGAVLSSPLKLPALPRSAPLWTIPSGWLVAISRGELRVIDAATGKVRASRMDLEGFSLVARTRDRDRVLLRGGDRRFSLYDAANRQLAEVDAPPEIMLRSVGRRYATGPVTHGPDDETLHLVDLDQATGSVDRKLARGATFTRMVLTDPDTHVLATSGEPGHDDETLVFETADGNLVDRFPGSLVSGRQEQDGLSGLEAVSPNGRYVVYRTPAGSLALRDLTTAAACVVRAGSDHRLAGFGRDGRIYAEANERPASRASGSTALLSYEPWSRDLRMLAEASEGLHLEAAPGHEGAEPFLVARRDASLLLVRGAEHKPDLLPFERAEFFLPPSDRAELWAIGLERSLEGNPNWTGDDNAPRNLTVGPFDPEAPPALGSDLGTPSVTLGKISPQEPLCVSLAGQGRWYGRCGRQTESESFAATSLPSSERDSEVQEWANAVCGNGRRESGESCDESDFGQLTCSSFTDDKGRFYTRGRLNCSATCDEVQRYSCQH